MKKAKIAEVLRAFLTANLLKREYGKINNLSDYEKTYRKISQKIRSLPEERLWRMIASPRRIGRYRKLNWYKGRIRLDDTGVWPRMGHISNKLLLKDARWSANRIYNSSGKIMKGELNHLFRIIPLAERLDRSVPIICVEGGMIRSKPHYKKQKYDIDDSCHRAICLALLGKKFVNAYIGVKRK